MSRNQQPAPLSPQSEKTLIDEMSRLADECARQRAEALRCLTAAHSAMDREALAHERLEFLRHDVRHAIDAVGCGSIPQPWEQKTPNEASAPPVPRTLPEAQTPLLREGALGAPATAPFLGGAA